MAFRFKQFTVHDELSSMKVGTDAVLLGAWAGRKGIERILDVGTGSGVIALMMAQRFPDATIIGIDLHKESIRQAEKNFILSPWSERLQALRITLQEMSTTQKLEFDLIVSNPPFFVDSVLPPDPSRKMARHTGTLSYEELVQCSGSLLKKTGNLSLILPYDSKASISAIMEKKDFHLQRESDIIPVRDRQPNRFLSEWGRTKTDLDSGELMIRKDQSTYSEEYKELTEEFYLAL
jgi:tRNA1Val (adenine37-N6)-methyltransferase